MKKMKEFFQSGTALTAVAITIILSLFFSDFSDAEEKRVRGEYHSGQITVTAQKQEENLQDVPVSMTVMDSFELEDRNIDGIWDLADHVPGLMNFDTGMSDMFAQPTMRGITAPTSTFNTSVGLYIDGVPVLSSMGYTAGLLDIERVEVLRGPQGTLYGKNTEAGAINIISRQPDNEVRGKAGVGYGEDNKQLILGTISGPIVKDKLFLGLNAQYDSKDGFIENTYLGGEDDDRKRYYGKTQLRWTPTKNWDISMILSRLAADEGLSPQTANAAMMAMYGLPPLPERKTAGDLRPERDCFTDDQALKIIYDVSDSIKISSITARKLTDWDAKGDYDFSPNKYYHVYNDSEYSNVSQELRLNWNSAEVKGVLGIYADKNENDVNYGDIISGRVSTKRNIKGDSHAVFGQFDYGLTQALNLIAGLRYERQNMECEDYLFKAKDDKSWDKFTPKFSVKYSLTPEINLYATIAEGYRTGGFNDTSKTSDYMSFDPEKLWSYEAGVKTSFFDNRLSINAGIYYMDIEDMQVEQSVTPLINQVTNAAEATSKGGEIEITAAVTRGLSLRAGLAYNDTTFDKFKDALGDYSGNKNPYAPEYTLNLGGTYRHGSGVFLSWDLMGYGEIYLDKANKNKRGAYELFNTKIGYETDKFDFYAYAENLFDEEYDNLDYYGYYNTYSPPREIGLRINYRF